MSILPQKSLPPLFDLRKVRDVALQLSSES